jgi:hypothetical protein
MIKGQVMEKSSRNDTSTLITNIKNEFKRINSDTEKLVLVTKDLEDISSQGGDLKLFYEENDLKKAVLIAYGETGRSTSEYYFEDGKLIFAYTRDEFYDKSIYDKQQPNIQKEEENRFYFFENKLIRWIDKNNKIVNPSEYLDKEKELIKEVKLLIEKNDYPPR